MKVKVESDLAAESKSMEEYSKFCDEETSAKGYQIKTSTRSIADLEATSADCKATVASADDEIVALGSELS